MGDGYVQLLSILQVKWLADLRCTIEDVKQVVESSDKKRFELMTDESGVSFIRAVQGHSLKIVDDEQLLRRLDATDADLPSHCVHGTYRKHLDGIFNSGGLIAGGCLGKGYRNHV